MKSNGRRIRSEVRNPVYEPEIKQALDPHIYFILLPEKTGYRSGNCLLKQFSSGKRLRQHFQQPGFHKVLIRLHADGIQVPEPTRADE